MLTCDLVQADKYQSSIQSLIPRIIHWDTPHGRKTQAILSFGSLSSKDEGQYKCIIAITSPYINQSLTFEKKEVIDLTSKSLLAV